MNQQFAVEFRIEGLEALTITVDLGAQALDFGGKVGAVKRRAARGTRAGVNRGGRRFGGKFAHERGGRRRHRAGALGPKARGVTRTKYGDGQTRDEQA